MSFQNVQTLRNRPLQMLCNRLSSLISYFLRCIPKLPMAQACVNRCHCWDCHNVPGQLHPLCHHFSHASSLSLTPYIIMKSYVLFVQIPLESSRFCYVHMTKSSSLCFHLTNEKLGKNTSGSCQVRAQFGSTTFGSAREHFVTNTEQLFRFPEAKTTLLVCETQIANTTERKEDIRVLFLLRYYPDTGGTIPNISSEI